MGLHRKSIKSCQSALEIVVSDRNDTLHFSLTIAVRAKTLKGKALNQLGKSSEVLKICTSYSIYITEAMHELNNLCIHSIYLKGH